MADTSWEYVIPGVGTYNDTSQDFEPVVPGVGTVNEGAAAAPGGSIVPIIMQAMNQFNGGTHDAAH